MFHRRSNARRISASLTVAFCALTSSTGSFALDSAELDSAEKLTRNVRPDKNAGSKRPKVSHTQPVTPSATINLVNLLVKQSILTEEQAQSLIKQATDEAYIQQQAAKDASAKAGNAAKIATAAAAAASPPGAKHVTYVPEIVKRQLRQDIKKEVMAQAEKENWASPGKYPEWASRIRFYGDMRLRYQGTYFPSGNDQIDAINFNAINTGAPYDVSEANINYFPPTYNVTRDRNQFRFRVRLGMEADLTNGFMAGLRIASGENSSPVSQNQTFAAATGGNFSKYAIWIDRAFMRYQPLEQLTLTLGRMDNPFWSPTDLVWYKDIGFDGLAVQAKHEIIDGVSPFIAGGAFPIYNTDFNVGSNSPPSKFASHDKWLFGGQLGAAAKINDDYSVRLAAAYYDFTNVQGRLSSPCLVFSALDVCDTDLTRPSFAQKGNTYIPLRNIIRDLSNNFGTKNQFQYFGLASQFRPVVASGQLDFGRFHPIHAILDGAYVVNTAFDRRAMGSPLVVNNNAGSPVAGLVGPFNGGNRGYLVRATIGDKEIKHLWDWNVHAGYRYLQSDAVIDAFVDSNFGLGGTNLKGYFAGGNLGLSENVWATVGWLSANNIAGVPYAVDILQVDLKGKF
jgi:hypothetical protein